RSSSRRPSGTDEDCDRKRAVCKHRLPSCHGRLRPELPGSDYEVILIEPGRSDRRPPDSQAIGHSSHNDRPLGHIGFIAKAIDVVLDIVNGATAPSDSALASLGVELHMTTHWSLSGKFDSQLARNGQTYA